MKKRWKGLCALWMVLALVIGAVPVAGASEDVPESAAAAVSEAAGDSGGQALAESGMAEHSSEESTGIAGLGPENTELTGKENSESPTEKGEGVESSSEKEEDVESSAVEGEGTESSAEKGEGAESSTEKGEGAQSSTEKGEDVESSAVEGEGVESSAKDKEEMSPEQSRESEETDKGTDSTEGTEEGIGESKEAAKEDGAAESSEAASEEDESGSEKTEESAALTAKAAAAREAAVSAEAWLYVGSNEVNAGDILNRSSDMSGITIQFDEPFNSQSDLDGITVPQDKRLTGWKLWEFNDSGMVGVSPLGELEIIGQISANDYQDFNIDNMASFLLIVPLWRDVRAILDGDSLEMNAGDSCDLSEGTWQVAVNADVTRDTTAYTGGRTVYAARSGTFTFHKKE